MHNYRYIEAGGQRFCFDIHPTYHCLLADTDPELAGETTPVVSAAVAAAADDLSCQAVLLARMLSRAHRSIAAGRQRVDGVLTERCAICGARMRRLGFACWIEERPSREDPRARIAKRLGMSDWQRVPGALWYRDRGGEARTWAQRRARQMKAGSA